MKRKPFLDFPVLLLNMAVILPPAFLYTVKSDYPHYLILATAILLFTFFQKEYLPFRDRPIIYTGTMALILTVIPDLLVGIDDSRVGLFDLVVRSNLAIPFLVYLAAFSCAFYPLPQRLGFTAACSAGAMLICGDRFYSDTLSNTMLPFLTPLLRNYTLTYAFSVTVMALALPFFFYSAYGSKNVPGRRFPNGNRIAKLFCILLIPVFAVAATRFYYKNESFMRTVEYYFLRIGMKRYMPQPGTNFLSQNVDLNSTLSPEMTADPDAVMFRAKAPSPPGYLRGGVYSTYEGGRWTMPKALPEQLGATRRATILSYSTFNVREDSEPARPVAIELLFDRLRSGGVVPAPGNTFRLDAVADSGDLTPSGIFSLKQWKPDGGCTLYVPSIVQEAVWQNPTPQDAELLDIPPELRAPLEAQLPREVLTARSDMEKVLALQMFFHEKFIYSLEPSARRLRGDPVIVFLANTRKGHCELFAASAVLMLRTQGIPARYVTGFLCLEKSTVSDYYIVRASHGDAWCEAYLREEKRWVLVEATPDNGLVSMRAQKDSSPKAVYDLLKQLFQQAFADVRRGHFANAVYSLIAGLSAFLWKLLKTVPGIIAAVTLAAAFVLFYWRKRKRVRAKRILFSPEMKALAAAFASFEKADAARTGRRRPPQATILEHYTEPEARKLCLRYEQLRYRTTSPTWQEVREFEKEVFAQFRKK